MPNLYRFCRQPVPFLFLLILCLTACSRSNKTELPEAEVSAVAEPVPAAPAKVLPPDADPSFVEPNAIVASFPPRTITRNMLQDKAGNLWFATWEGIVRYDGKRFTNLTLEANLRRFHAMSILEEKASGTLWFGTIGAGVYRYVPSSVGTGSQSFTNFTDRDGLASNSVLCMLEEKNGTIWFGTENGLSRYDGRSFTNFTTREGLNHNFIWTILEDKNGTIWFGTKGGACYYDGNSFTNFNNGKGRPFFTVRSIWEDKTGNLWFASGEGLDRYDPSSVGPSSKAFTNFTTNSVGFIAEATTGTLWFGVAKGRGMGVYRYDGAAFREVETGTRQYSQVFCMVEDKAGNLWFGTDRGSSRYDPSVIGTGSKSFIQL